MSNPGYCPACKQSGWACRCGREPLPPVTDGVEALTQAATALLNRTDNHARETCEPVFLDEREALRAALALAADVLARYPNPFENADRENDDEPFEVESIKGLRRA